MGQKVGRWKGRLIRADGASSIVGAAAEQQDRKPPPGSPGANYSDLHGEFPFRAVRSPSDFDTAGNGRQAARQR